MTETPTEPSQHKHDPPPTPDLMPRWVPVAIGVVLISLASLAVITGLRYRDNTLVNIVKPRRTVQRITGPAPPGEPEPGASLVLSGDSSNVPAANADADAGAGVVEMSARRGIKINATPPDAVVYVNDVPVGQATQFDSDDEIYDFAAPGSYTVRLTAPGHRDREFIVWNGEDATTDVAIIQAKLAPVTVNR